jgi:hypothetical protein
MKQPNKKTLERCERFSRSVVEHIKSEGKRLELEASDIRGVIFGIGISAAIDGGADVEEICKLVHELSRRKSELG